MLLQRNLTRVREYEGGGGGMHETLLHIDSGKSRPSCNPMPGRSVVDTQYLLGSADSTQAHPVPVQIDAGLHCRVFRTRVDRRLSAPFVERRK
jgi:hypothetical protein